MESITYKEVTFVKVFLEGKYIGDIKIVKGGWAYFPKGRKEHGDVYSTINAVKATL